MPFRFTAPWRLCGRATLPTISPPSPSLIEPILHHQHHAPTTTTTTLTTRRSFGIRSLNPPKHSRFDNPPGLPLLTSHPKVAAERKANTTPLRPGVLARKIGMSAVYDPETAKRIPCTILQLDRCQVVAHKHDAHSGYFGVQVGGGWKAKWNVPKAMLGHFAKAGVAPKRFVREFRVRDEAGLVPVGTTLRADHFVVGQFVDARVNSRGMGFTGVMKRHGFHGQDRSHGVSLTHRSLGSSGPGQGGGSRVYPGKKMAGRSGNERVTTQNLKVLMVDADKGIIAINGMSSLHPGSELNAPIPVTRILLIFHQQEASRARSRRSYKSKTPSRSRGPMCQRSRQKHRPAFPSKLKHSGRESMASFQLDFNFVHNRHASKKHEKIKHQRRTEVPDFNAMSMHTHALHEPHCPLPIFTSFSATLVYLFVCHALWI